MYTSSKDQLKQWWQMKPVFTSRQLIAVDFRIQNTLPAYMIAGN